MRDMYEIIFTYNIAHIWKATKVVIQVCRIAAWKCNGCGETDRWILVFICGSLRVPGVHQQDPQPPAGRTSLLSVVEAASATATAPDTCLELTSHCGLGTQFPVHISARFSPWKIPTFNAIQQRITQQFALSVIWIFVCQGGGISYLSSPMTWTHLEPTNRIYTNLA